MSLAIAPKLDKILHLASKITIEIAKLRVINFCPFCACVCQLSRDYFPRYFTYSIAPCHLHGFVYRDTNSTSVLFRHRKNWAIGISLLRVNHYICTDIGPVKTQAKLFTSGDKKRKFLEYCVEISYLPYISCM